MTGRIDLGELHENDPALEKLSPAQRSVADAIMTGPRKTLNGPFNAWLRSPELADRLQKVGEYIRFNSSLDKRVNEMAIIMTAQAWGSQYEWHAHAPLALKAGLDPAIITAIGAGRKPRSCGATTASTRPVIAIVARRHAAQRLAVERHRR